MDRSRVRGLNSEGRHAGEPKEENTILVGVGPPEEAGRQFQELKLPRVLNLGKEGGEHPKWTHLEQVQHCTDLPLQITFSALTKQEKMGPELEKEERKSLRKKRKKKKEKEERERKREEKRERKREESFASEEREK